MTAKSIKLNEGQQAAVDAIIQGRNVFVTGAGGTGKSIVAHRAVERLEDIGKEVLICAPTGIAAQHIHGSTIHSVFRFGFAPKVADELENCQPSDAVQAADVIVIDEIGMVRRDLMDAIARVVECERDRRKCRKHDKNRPLQLVLIGDFAQLPPIVTDRDRPVLASQYRFQTDPACMYAFAAEGWFRMNLEVHVLTEIMRQNDHQFIGMLNLARFGDSACIDYFNQFSRHKAPVDAVYLVARNKDAEELNTERLKRIKGRKKTFQGTVSGEYRPSDMASPIKLTLRIGARVILTASSPNVYVNGSTGTVKGYTAEGITVQLDDGNCVYVKPFTWENILYEVEEGADEKRHLVQKIVGTYTQYPIKLAWAITFHKSQGQTLSNVVINPATFGAGMLYVGLSRATSAGGLYLTSKINPNNLRADPAVVDFYRSICA